MGVPLAELGTIPPLGLLNRLMGDTGKWGTLAELLADVRTAFNVVGISFRWPSDGNAVFSASAGVMTGQPLPFPVLIPGKTLGVLTVCGNSLAMDWLKLLSNTLGYSPYFERMFAPFADQARIAQRLEDAGRVAGRVAHDFDNVFQGVTGFTSLAMETVSANSPTGQNLKEVQTACNHGLKFNVQLHQLSRGGKAQPFPAAVQPAITREIARIQRTHPTLKLDVLVPTTLPPVAIETGGLQTILGHLLDNAAEASPKTGTVTVAARLIDLTQADSIGLLAQPTLGQNVELTIRDSGPGLTDDARRKMFVEPFFTTKFRHRGLSLTIVYRMLYAHRAGVQAISEPGLGTTIRLVLPLSVQPPVAISSSKF